MDAFSSVYSVPFLGKRLHSFLSVADEAELDSTSKTLHTLHRKDVYPLTHTLDLDKVGRETTAPIPYLKKVSPYVRVIQCTRNPGRIALPTVAKLPSLVSLTYAVPLLLDTTLRRIHPSTLLLWSKVNAFLQSLYTTDHRVRTVRIVPGPVILVRTDVDTGDILEEHVLDDCTEGSHLQIYRKYGMPVVLSVARPRTPFFGESVGEIRIPTALMSYGMQKSVQHTSWSVHSTGIASVVLDLTD
jgi:hypothetical protein